MKVRFLGSAAAGGLPQWNCGGTYSVRARANDPRVRKRTQEGLAISSDDRRWSLVGASPDLRDQLTHFGGSHPRTGTRDVPLDSIVLLNAEPHHVAGLLGLSESLPYRVITTAFVRDALLGHNAMFRPLEPAFGCVALDQRFDLDREQQLEAKLFPVAGGLPAYLEGHAGPSAEATLGLRVTDKRSGRRLVYVPKLRALDEATLAEFQAADVRVVDGTFWDANELARVRPGAPDAWKSGHIPVGGPDGSLTRLRLLGGQTWYTHLNNTNPLVDAGSEEAAFARNMGVFIATDGAKIEV